MSDIYQTIKQTEQKLKERGQKFVGAVVNLNVRIGTDQTVPIQAIYNKVASTNISKDWLPEQRDPVSLYLAVAASMSRGSARSFDFPSDYPSELKDNFKGYSVNRLWFERDSDRPCGHRVIYRHATRTAVDQVGSVPDLEVEHSIMVILKRVEHGNGFQIEIKLDPDFEDSAYRYFEPFLHTLMTRFNERLDGEYNSTELRKIILDVILNKVQARSVNDGLYFVPKGDKLTELNAFCEALGEVHNGIKLLNFTISDGEEGTLERQNFEAISDSLTVSLVKELKDLKAELEQFDAAEGTRSSTWIDRAQRISEIKAEIRDLRSEQMLISDITDDLLKECQEIVNTNLL